MLSWVIWYFYHGMSRSCSFFNWFWSIFVFLFSSWNYLYCFLIPSFSDFFLTFWTSLNWLKPPEFIPHAASFSIIIIFSFWLMLQEIFLITFSNLPIIFSYFFIFWLFSFSEIFAVHIVVKTKNNALVSPYGYNVSSSLCFLEFFLSLMVYFSIFLKYLFIFNCSLIFKNET